MKCALVVVLVWSASAFADGDPSSVTPTPEPAPAPVDDWSSEIGNRSLVTPESKLELHLGLPIVGETTTTDTGIRTYSTGELLALGASYGVIPKLEVGADYSAILHPDASASGLLALHAAYAVLHKDKLDLAVAGSLSFNLEGSTSVGLNFGAWLRYRITNQISVFTGNNGTPTTLAGLGVYYQPLPLGYQLALGFNNNQPLSLAFPVGIGFQATPNVYAFFTTELLDVYFHNGPSGKTATVIFGDIIPIAIGGFYSLAKFDVGLEFADDLKDAGNDFVITLAGRYYIK